MQWNQEIGIDEALEHGLKDQEYEGIVQALGRKLNLLELGICSALYSEHCSYKSTKIHLKNLPTEGPQVLQGPGENAGVIAIGNGQAVVFKVESHNHPSYIEPYQGAATGVGGILRDVFTMGARPLALMNALRFGEEGHFKTKHLLSGSVAGIGGYGNCMGIPTIGGELFFHKAYNGNCLVNAFALGLVEEDSIFLGTASGIGNSIIYVGSKTGRDGIHGATMASDVFEEDSEAKRPTVQVGDPFQEKLLLEACLEAMATGAIVGIQDMGAAGLTSSAYEMAARAGTGIHLDLDLVPQREEGMSPYEIMLSESQERMLLIVEKGREAEVLDIVKHWELDAVKIGEVIEGENVELYWHKELASAMPVAVVTESVPEYSWPEKEPVEFKADQAFDLNSIPVPNDLSAVCLKLLASINYCSRAAVYEQYDSTVRSNTVVHPGGDAAVIRVKANSAYNLSSHSGGKIEQTTEQGIAMTLDCNSIYCSLDPHLGTELSIAEAYRNISAVGARAIGVSDCLNFGSPERPEGMWQIAESLRGMTKALKKLSVPVISGNVSLYNESPEAAILPTPMIAMVGLIEDASKAQTIGFKSLGDSLLVVGKNTGEIGGSAYLAEEHKLETGALPELDYDLEIRTSECIRELIEQGLLSSCHDISNGGVALALVESCLASQAGLGARLDFVEQSDLRPDFLLFSETPARYLLSCKPENEEAVSQVLSRYAIEVSMKGEAQSDSIKISNYIDLALEQAREAWQKGLDEII